ncbi:DNA repair protein RecO [Gangjinia marincola]|uniref:DNA repair protein RecO n=1 Tax=Gangjinia marincola TaxID=578463 RepID=A0ABP3XW98_9FLAO
MQVQTKAIVISAIKYSEADLIVKCYTKVSGLKTYLLRGILKSKKGKVRAALFQPLTQLELIAVHKDKGNLERINEAKISFPYQSLHTDITKTALLFFLSDVLKTSIQEEEKNISMFNFLQKSMIWLDQHDHIANFHVLFLLKLSSYLGFYPDETNLQADYFNMLDGTFQSIETNSYCITGNNVSLLKVFLGMNFDDLGVTKITKTDRLNVLEMLLSYYELHLHGFKKPQSVKVLNEIFN